MVGGAGVMLVLVFVVLSAGITIPFLSAPQSISQRPFWDNVMSKSGKFRKDQDLPRGVWAA